MSQARKAEAFAALHRGEPFLIPNPWDAGSARVLEALGFPALATTSSGFAFTLGRLDGGAALDEVVAHTAALAGAPGHLLIGAAAHKMQARLTEPAEFSRFQGRVFRRQAPAPGAELAGPRHQAEAGCPGGVGEGQDKRRRGRGGRGVPRGV